MAYFTDGVADGLDPSGFDHPSAPQAAGATSTSVLTRPRLQGGGGPLIRVEGMNVTYRGRHGDVRAVKDVDLEVGVGEQVAIVGESGSGKTSLGMALAGYLSTTTGATVTSRLFEFDGSPLVRPKTWGLPRRTPGIGMIFQDAMTSLDPVWTIGSQLKSVLAGNGPKRSRRDLDERAREWLVAVGLTDTRRVMKSRPYELSGGMRQRAMMAIALSGEPRLLIADEPTSALDASLSRSVMELMRTLAVDTGTALLVVSHDVRLCAEFTDRMIVMYEGEAVEQGFSDELEHGAVHPYTRGLLQCVPDLQARHRHRLPVLSDFLDAAGVPTAFASSEAEKPCA